jgi:hypothetical protein
MTEDMLAEQAEVTDWCQYCFNTSLFQNFTLPGFDLTL